MKTELLTSGRLRWLGAAMIAVILIGVASCERGPASPAPTTAADGSVSEDLLIGYELLADTLRDESKLRWLDLLKKLTFSRPTDGVSDFLEKISSATKTDARRLDQLRTLAPDASAEPRTTSVIGDAITAGAKSRGSEEMLDRHGAFNIRFMLLQAQALRMIAVMAAEIAELDPNPQRSAWLTEIAVKYESYRDELVAIFGMHCTAAPVSARAKEEGAED